MKLSEIKTRDQFNAMVDTKYQRTIRLARAMNDETKHPAYRIKASVLWLKMMKKVQVLVSIYAKATISKNLTTFKSGGVISKIGTYGSEYVAPKHPGLAKSGTLNKTTS